MVATLETDGIRRSDENAESASVLHLVPELDGGPRTRAVIEMAAAAVAVGARAFIAAPDGRAAVDVQRAGAVHVSLPLDRDNLVTHRANAARIEALIREQGITLVHAHGRSPASCGSRAARRLGVPFVATFHRPYQPGGMFSGNGAQAMVDADAAIGVSHYVAETVFRRFPALDGKLHFIPYSVDIERYDPARVSAERVIQLATQWRLPDGVPVVMAGGLASRKSGHATLIEALGRLAAREHYCLMFAAPEEFETTQREIEELARQHGVAARVHLLEPPRDMPATLMLADVVAVTPAEPEPFSLVIAEAQSMGRPVVAADHGAAHEQVADQPMGWLVPPGDAGALATALGEALDLTPQQRQHRAHDAIAAARQRYARSIVGDALIALYDSLLPDQAPALTGQG